MKLKNQIGMGLLEVTISGAILATLVMYIAQLNSNMSKMSSKMEVQMDEMAFKKSYSPDSKQPCQLYKNTSKPIVKEGGKITTPQECDRAYRQYNFDTKITGSSRKL